MDDVTVIPTCGAGAGWGAACGSCVAAAAERAAWDAAAADAVGCGEVPQLLLMLPRIGSATGMSWKKKIRLIMIYLGENWEHSCHVLPNKNYNISGKSISSVKQIGHKIKKKSITDVQIDQKKIKLSL